MRFHCCSDPVSLVSGQEVSWRQTTRSPNHMGISNLDPTPFLVTGPQLWLRELPRWGPSFRVLLIERRNRSQPILLGYSSGRLPCCHFLHNELPPHINSGQNFAPGGQESREPTISSCPALSCQLGAPVADQARMLPTASTNT